MKGLLARLPVRVIAPLLLVLPVLLAAVVLIAISAVQGRAAVNRLASQQLEQIHDQISQHVDSLVSMPARVDQANIAMVRNGRFDPEHLRDWAPVLVEQFRAFPMLSAISWGGEDGHCTWVARYQGDDQYLYYAIKDGATGGNLVEHHVNADGEISAEPVNSIEFDTFSRPWYATPRDAGRPTWCEPYVWVGGGESNSITLGISYGIPYFDGEGSTVGVMDADLSLQDISRYLSTLEIGRTGRAYMIDSQGLLLASSTQAALVDETGGRMRAADSEAAYITVSARHLAERFGSIESVDKEFQGTIDVAGARQWLRVSPFVHETGLNWNIATIVPESDFMSEIAAGRRRSAWFTALVTLATLGLGVLLAMLLARPIVNLSRHVRRIGEGDLEQEIQLPYPRELVQLSDDINEMASGLRDRMALRRSLALAMEVQQNLLPSESPTIRGLDIAGHSTYCDETGGDYYDYLDIAGVSDSTVALAVGDVMGHGIAAAMLMATARGILRSRSTESNSLGDMLGHLNELLVEVTGGSRFMTMVLLTIDGSTGKLRLASAGHDTPFIYNRASDEFIELESSGLPLGVMEGEEYEEVIHTALPPGSVIIASTDGVWEAQNEAEEQYGKSRISEIIRAHASRSAQEISDALRSDVQRFCGEQRHLDDITFVVVKRTEAAN